MVDWTGHEPVPPDRLYRLMAERELHGVSPSYERLCLGVAGDREVLAAIETLPGIKRQPNLLLGAVRFLDGPVEAYEPFREFVLSRWDELAAIVLARRTQTNEARRCASLLPVLAGLPQPLALLEVGASAGLCLYPDRYAYRYGAAPVIGESPLVLECAVTGPVPLPGAVPQVVWRAGLDLHPLDVHDDADVRWLECLIWPEHADRFATLREAVAIARSEPAPVHAGDLLTDVAALAAEAPSDATLVVFHSAVLAYLTAAQRAKFAADLRGSARPVRWVANEAAGVLPGTERLRGPRSQFAVSLDGVPVALAAPHGQELTWLD